MLEEFRQFALRGNVVDMAVGIVIGGAFGTIASSLVNNILMPPIGLLLGEVDFADLFVVIKTGSETGPPYPTLAAAQEAGAVTVNYGMFINSLVSFLIVAAAMFFVVRAMNRLQREQPKTPEPAARKCPYCRLEVAEDASRCPHCTSELKAVSTD